MQRNELTRHNKNLAATAQQAGVVTPVDYAVFQTTGYKGLYGGFGAKDIHAFKAWKKSRQKSSTTWAAPNWRPIFFRATQAEEKLRRDGTRSKVEANRTHHEVGGRCGRRSRIWGRHDARKTPNTGEEHQGDRRYSAEARHPG